MNKAICYKIYCKKQGEISRTLDRKSCYTVLNFDKKNEPDFQRNDKAKILRTGKQLRPAVIEYIKLNAGAENGPR